MNTLATVPAESAVLARGVAPHLSPSDGSFAVLLATGDQQVRHALTGILEGQGVDVEWAKGVESAKRLLTARDISACLCGFGLEDGSYRDLVKYAKHQPNETPVIIISTPSCPNEYGEYLAAMNTGAFDFLCYPYQKREVERILRLAVASFRHQIR